MSQITEAPERTSAEKRGELSDGALSEEVLDSSRSVLRPTRGGEGQAGLQQFFSPPELSELIAAVNGRRLATLDPTAGDGSLLAAIDRQARFGIEIDADHLDPDRYEGIQGDVQQAYPLLRTLGVRFPRLACNPPFGLDWQIAGKPVNSTLATWRMTVALLADHGAGAFLAGRDRFMRDVMGREDAAGVYALVEADDLFEGVELPVVLAFFVPSAGVEDPRPGGPLRLEASRATLTGLAPQILEERTRIGAWVVNYELDRGAIGAAFGTVGEELGRRREERRRSRPDFDLSMRSGRISVGPRAFARLALQRRRLLREIERLDRQPPTYFALNLREWRRVEELVGEGVLTVSPGLRTAVESATGEAERDICPLYEVRPQQRLAFLDDLDSIICTESDPERGFEAGERYPLEAASEIRTSSAERPHTKRNGDIEVRRYEQEAKVLRVQVGEETFDESAEDVGYLLGHFELPDPGDLASRHPEEVEEARSILRDLADHNDFEFKRSATEDWQLEDLARLVVKGSGLLCWEQGGGKSLGGATLIHAAWERGAARKGLIVCPQDLIPQWIAEIRRFYGIAPVHITSPSQARRVARELRAGGTGLYITHYEVLSLVGRVDEPLPVVEIKIPAADDGPARTVVDSTEFCPACLASFEDGWQKRSDHVCERCHHVHKRLRVKSAGHHLAHAFADGVIVVDEGTLAKGDGSLRSKAIRGLRARNRYLLTGTPISNYVNDAFWLLWWALGNATLRFPFAYEGGRAKFEADFCVIEHWRDSTDNKRKNRKVLPQVTNVSRLWRLLCGAMVRRRKQHMGELPPRTTRTIAAPMGIAQQELYRFWLDSANFRRYFEWKFPNHPLAAANLIELFAAGLGQLTKLEYATTLPEADPDLGTYPRLAEYEHSNWTPKNLKVLQVAMEHVEAGGKVLIGSDLIETGRWLTDRLREKGVAAAHIVEERSGRSATLAPRKRAQAIERFKTGSTQVLCCGIPSIRLGHSLEAASCVIANGLVFSYEMFDQFIARAWRLTSPGPVSVYVALTLGSLDPRKWQLLCQKAKAADLALDGQLVDEPEQPISREEFLRDLRRQGVRPTGEEIAEADIEAAWRAAPMLRTGTIPMVRSESGVVVDWHSATGDTEQLDLFVAV